MKSTDPSSQAWDDTLLKDPHAAADKRDRVRRMFAAIAPSYDLNNRLHSLWQDQRWRRKAVDLAHLKPDDVVVDVACGTGDLTLAFARHLHGRNGTINAIGIDFTFEMLPLARAKSHQRRKDPLSLRERVGVRGRTEPASVAAGQLPSAIPSPGPAGRPLPEGEVCPARQIAWLNADALALPLPGACCDVVSIAFGIRNVADPLAALREFHRILRPGGRVVILEFSLPENRLLRGLYNFYFRKILPRTATLISRDKTGAYRYLPESVNTFISRQRMVEMMAEAGFSQIEQHPLTFGVCICYVGRQ